MVVKAGYFSKALKPSDPIKKKLEEIGWNTGNLVFINAIRRIFDCDRISIHDDVKRLAQYRTFITNDLIWLREGDRPWDELRAQLRVAGDCPLVPLSVGLQAPEFRSDFTIPPDMVNFLKAVAERVPLPTRGTYTAEILERHGIKNVKVLGCPSLYQLPLYSGALTGLARNHDGHVSAIANMSSVGAEMSDKERDLLMYFPGRFTGFIDQTMDLEWKLSEDLAPVKAFLKQASHTFFDLESWVSHCAGYNFSMGARFHGNVVPLLKGVRSLFITVDSRTAEMVRFLKLPHIDIADFDIDKDIRHYYEISSYEGFISNYGNMMNDFVNYAAENDIPLSSDFEEAVKDLLPASHEATA
jgi:hypothetical protein